MASEEATKDIDKENTEEETNNKNNENNAENNQPSDAEKVKNEGNNEKEEEKGEHNGNDGNVTPRSARSPGDKMKNQMMQEIDRVRKEMLYSASLIRRPKPKPYSPDIFNSLSPYYNTYLVDYIKHDQNPIYHPWGSYGQRETAQNIVDPEKSLKMDTFPLPPVETKIPGQLYKIKVWSKNLSGKDQDLGSTRLPPVPPLAVRKPPNPEYQYFKMTYDEVPKFRQDVKKMYSAIEEKRKKSDYERVEKDWKRMNIDELKELPERSRFHYGKTINTYLGTSKGSAKAVHTLGRSLSSLED